MKSKEKKPLKSILIVAMLLSALAMVECCGEKTPPADQTQQQTNEQTPTPDPAKKERTVLRMATTTSTENSGLLDCLLPLFEKKYNVDVQVIAVGTGKALELGRNGDVDVVLVHARQAEEEFVDGGFGVDRRDVMYNDFVILGPESDPAGIDGMDNAVAALAMIAEAAAPFMSRGDDSGTHKKELQLWAEAGITPNDSWYMETGQGMGPTLTIADEKLGYVLCDRGTFIAYRDKIDLDIAVQGDAKLANPYGIIAVNQKKYEHINYSDATTLIQWITSTEGQEAIGEFTIDGEILFYPDAK